MDAREAEDLPMVGGHPAKPTVKHPKLYLALFSIVNFVSYYDRGAISGCLSTIKSDTGIAGGADPLSDTQAGAVVSAFIFGFMVFSPIFAALGGVIRPSFIVASGLVGWCIACFMTSMARTYPMLILARSLVGVGEAAFCGFIPTMIDDFAPPKSRTRFIGMYFAMVPVGTALGMVGGGVLHNFNQDGEDEHSPVKGWQFNFFMQCWIMLPVIAACIRLPAHLGTGSALGADAPPDCSKSNSPSSPQEGDELLDPEEASPAADPYPTAWQAVKLLARNPIFIFTVLGYALYTFVLGGVAAWGILFMEQGELNTPTNLASVTFGLSTAVTGIIGTLIGGWFVDRQGGSKGNSGMLACSKFNAAVTLVSVPCGLFAFTCTSMPVFLVFVIVAEVLLFTTTAPVNSVVLEAVGTQMRTYSMAICTFFIHALGDVLSPILVGAASDSFSQGCPAYTEEAGCSNDTAHGCKWIKDGSDPDSDGLCRNEVQLRNAMLVLYASLILAPIFWSIAAVVVKRRIREEERGAPPGDEPQSPAFSEDY